jgi:hypothetical protein
MRICRTIGRSVSGDVGAAITAKRLNSKAQGRAAHPGLTGRIPASAPRRGATDWRATPRNSVLSTQYSVLGTRYSVLSTPSSNPVLQPWLLPALFAALILLPLAGCSPYEPEKIRTGGKPITVRTQQQINGDLNSTQRDLEKLLRNVRNADSAKSAAEEVTKLYARFADLCREGHALQKEMTPEQKQGFEEQISDSLTQTATSVKSALLEIKKTVPQTPELQDAIKKGESALTNARAEATAPPPEVLPQEPPKDAASWPTMLVCILVLGACVGCLFRDGIWSNALRLVNVIFAGLLAMNFYEFVASWLTNFSEDFHTFVAMWDFLAFWACFVVFVVVFRAITDSVSKVRVRFLQIVDLYGGIALSLCVGWIMVGITLTSLHLSPLAQYPLLGSFQPQNSMLFGLNPDREWLGFTRYQSKSQFCRPVSEEQLEEYAFPKDFIEAQLVRRMHVEYYVQKNQALRINPKMVAPPKPAG